MRKDQKEIDCISQDTGLLIASNRPNFLFDVGGELIVSGSKHGAPWVIGIQDPIEFSNQAITNIVTDSF